MSGGHDLTDGLAALDAGHWTEARAAFERALAEQESAPALFGSAMALWWLGENRPAVQRCARAHALFRRAGEVADAIRTAVWLAIVHKANCGSVVAANGWVARAERLLEPLEPGPLHGWAKVARAYRMVDLDAADDLTASALEVARSAGDTDLELTAVSQLGLIRVGQGRTDTGFGMIDEAMVAALAGEATTLDTVVYTCCDMLNACELVADVDRAAQWCAVADDFIGTYGCPFLYAECRIYYGSVLTSTGRWADAERELTAGLQITAGASPGLHRRALLRLAGLRVRQGRLEEADRLLAEADGGDEVEQALWSAAAALARGDATTAGRLLEHRLRDLHEHRWHVAAALDLLVDARITEGDLDGARAAAVQLAEAAGRQAAGRLAATAAAAAGRVALARGDRDAAAVRLREALRQWADLDLPYETGRTRFDLARALDASEPELAEDHARRALAVLDRIGAGADADRVAAFLRARGITPRTGVRGTGDLSVRESEVLRLLADGLTNPEIARRLHVTSKTASHHVSSILAKLGLRNRAEAAAHAVVLLGRDTLRR